MIPCKPKTVGPDGLIVRKRFSLHPVVISAKRFAAIKGRSRQDEKHAQIEAVEEERRYRQYLKDGNDLLCSLFSDPTEPKVVAPVKSKDTPKEVDTKLADERLRKERIIRANNFMNQLKPGPRALHRALLLSEMIHQRKYHEALNEEIAAAARAQEEADEVLCPAVLVPFGYVTEEEEKAKETEKNQIHAELMRQDIKEREKIREAEREQRIFEERVDRAQYKCLQDKEEAALKVKKAQKIAFYRKAHREAIQEKAEIAKHERICDKIDDRRNCVYNVASRNLNTRYGAHVKKIRKEKQDEREANALRVSQAQDVAKRLLQEQQATVENRHDFEREVDENRRKCEIEELAKQRRAYQLEERRQVEEKLRHERELQRFQVARRLKNAEANRYFNASLKRRQDKVKADLRNMLFSQREEFLQRRRDELMNRTACGADPYLEDDKKFFQEAVDIMEESRKVGRPLYPIATAVKRYERQNELDMDPEGRSVKRSQLRDVCWPGFYSKAELAYHKYEQREKCREEQVLDRHQIYCNSVKIAKLAEVEKPYVPCKASCPINCFHHRGLPATDSCDSFDYARHVCYEEPPTVGACPGPMQVIHNDPLDNTRRISQTSIHLPPMPGITKPTETALDTRRSTGPKSSMSKVMPVTKESKGSIRAAPQPTAAPEEKRRRSTIHSGKTSQADLHRAHDPPLPKSQPPKSQPPKSQPPKSHSPKSHPPKSQSSPIQGRRASASRFRKAIFGSKSGSKSDPPPVGNDIPAPIPNPKGTWGSGPLPPPLKKK